MSITGEPDGAPTKVGVAVVDVLCGLHAAAGILAALRSREQTGQGRRIEVSLLDSGLAGLINVAGRAQHGGRGAPVRQPGGQSHQGAGSHALPGLLPAQLPFPERRLP